MNTAEKKRILIIDDEAVNLKLLGEILKEDYELAFAKSGEEALSLVKNLPQLILMDIMMPGMDGYELLRLIKTGTDHPEVPVIFISAMNEATDEIKGLQLGAVDYVSKPVNPAILKLRVKTQLDLVAARNALALQNESLEQQVHDRTRDIEESQIEMVKRMGLLAEYRDPETGDHIERMSRYSEIMAQAAGLTKEHCILIRRSAPMHDIGKVAIPDRILVKPGKLDAEEWRTMQSHCLIGATMLSGGRSKLLRTAHLIALYHHEKWDGSGYPNGCVGEDIPIEGRITAIADVFDALSSKRPYKKAFPMEKVLDIMKEGEGTHFDPLMLKVFFDQLPVINEIKEAYPE